MTQISSEAYASVFDCLEMGGKSAKNLRICNGQAVFKESGKIKNLISVELHLLCVIIYEFTFKAS